MDRGGGGQVVRVLAFYTYNPSLNLNEAYNSFYIKKILLQKNENKQKEAGLVAFEQTILSLNQAHNTDMIATLLIEE